jgi:hypothetical protein
MLEPTSLFAMFQVLLLLNALIVDAQFPKNC